MNRDEKRARSIALPPEINILDRRRVVYPRESAGGTWIAANDAGVCVALINWHRIEREPSRAIASRGDVPIALAGKTSAAEIGRTISSLSLKKFRPFRLIAIVPTEKSVTEWRWDLKSIVVRKHPWKTKHWFSSGFDERRAERVRAKVCASFVAGGDDPGLSMYKSRARPTGVTAAGYSLNALRRLHRSHEPARGPFSICMHRTDAATVSYTEVGVTSRSVVMAYKNGPLCSSGSTITKKLAFEKL